MCACVCVSVNGDEAIFGDELDYANHFHYEGSDLVVEDGSQQAGSMLTVSRSQSSLRPAITSHKQMK